MTAALRAAAILRTNDMNLENRVALITGGARIGKAVAKALAERRINLVLTYHRSKTSAEESAQYARSQGCKVLLIKADLTFPKDIADIIPKVKKAFGQLDILINMASTFDQKPLLKLKRNDWDHGLATNLNHVYYLSMEAAKLMQKNRFGRIINFADWASISHRPRYTDLAPYYVSKAGVSAVTEVLALGLAPDILVNAIAPGPILAPSYLTQEEHQEVIKATPLKKWGGAGEIAKTVLFLVDTEFITGETIRVDGGRHLH